MLLFLNRQYFAPAACAENRAKRGVWPKHPSVMGRRIGVPTFLIVMNLRPVAEHSYDSFAVESLSSAKVPDYHPHHYGTAKRDEVARTWQRLTRRLSA